MLRLEVGKWVTCHRDLKLKTSCCWLGVLAGVFVWTISGAPSRLFDRAHAEQRLDVLPTQRVWNVPEFKRATEAYMRGDCKEAWELLWPLAKKANHQARYLLWSFTLDRMIPPGRELQDEWAPHHLVLPAYAALAPPGSGDPTHAGARAEIQRAISGLKLGSKGEQVARCYRSGGSFQSCLELGISLGVLPRFEDYAAKVDAEAAETNTLARCRARPW